MFWKKKKNDTIYASLNRRLFAGMVDLFLLIVIWTPLENIILKLIYQGKPSPSQMMSMDIQQKLEASSASNQPSLGTIFDSFNNVSSTYGLGGLLIEQFLPLFILAILTFIFWVKRQATPGKMFMSLRVVDNKTLGKPTKLQFITRLLAYPISFIPLGLGMFFVVFNKNKRALHDFIAGTAVIKVQKKKNEK